MEGTILLICFFVWSVHMLRAMIVVPTNYEAADEDMSVWIDVLCDIRHQQWADYQLLVLLSTQDRIPEFAHHKCLDLPVVLLTNQGPSLDLSGRLNINRVAAILFVYGTADLPVIEFSLKLLPKQPSLKVVITLLCVLKKTVVLNEAVNALWSSQLTNAVILYKPSSDRVIFYRYFPYSDRRCQCPGSPVRVADWTPGALLDSDIFANNTLRDLSGCYLLCGTFNHPPSMTVFNGTATGLRLMGTLKKIADSLMAIMNFKCTFKQPDDGRDWGYTYSNGTSYGLHGEVSEGVVHVGFADFINNLDRWKITDLSFPYTHFCLTVAVPSGLGRKKSAWFVLAGEFSKEVWMVLAVTLFVAIFFTSIGARLLVIKHTVLYIILFNLQTFMGAPIHMRVKEMRAYLSLWLLFSMAMGVFYMAAFSSLVTLSYGKGDIDTLEQLLQVNIKIIAHPTLVELLSKGGDQLAETLLAKRFEFSTEPVAKVIESLISTRDRGVFNTRRSLMYALTQISEDDSKKFHILKDYCNSAGRLPVSAFVTKKGSALSPRFNSILKNLVESGLVKHWINSMPERKRGCGTIAKAFTLRNVISAFRVLGVGLLVASLVFCGELVVYKDFHHRCFF